MDASTRNLSSPEPIRAIRTKVRERSGTNRDWLAERARELGLSPPSQMDFLRVRTLRNVG